MLYAHLDTVTTASQIRVPGIFSMLQMFVVGLCLMQSLKPCDCGKKVRKLRKGVEVWMWDLQTNTVKILR